MTSIKKNIMPRYFAIIAIMGMVALAIIGKIAHTMFVEREYWAGISKNSVRDSVTFKATRGRILSSDGQLMASSLPEYKIVMDFRAGGAQKDSLLGVKMDSICDGLHRIIPEWSSAQFRKRIEEGRAKKSRYWTIYPRRISYTQYKAVKELPVFRMSPYKGGFIAETFNNRRKKPFGSLASRTLGNILAVKDSAISGLEQTYDSVLRGTDGFVHRQKVRNKWLSITDVPPVNGCDIVSTIDVSMQDICEKALTDKMREINATVGVVILMEVATGDVKAIVNMSKQADGSYAEDVPHAIADMMEPGSTFKTASIMVALDDGVVDIDDKVETGCGLFPMHGATVRDHNWRTGGYGTISVPQVLMYSSNVGTSRIIDEHYYSQPEKYVDGLYRIGIAEDLKLPLREYHAPRIRRPKPDRSNWSKTALAWMSFGYETQIAPINTVTFYNAIANDGKMVRPRFVKQIEKDGGVIRRFEPEVIREQICKPATLQKIRDILRLVVKDGVAKKAGSKQFHISGKTGTAQISQGKGGYKTGTTCYLISFCGYFPSETPRYTCIVAMQKKGSPASGGGMCGPVFRNIAERIYAKDLTKPLEEAQDTLHGHLPNVKNGDMQAAGYVLEQLNIQNRKSWSGDDTPGTPVWGTAQETSYSVHLTQNMPSGQKVPNVIGMGAKDAVFLLENCGMHVQLHGTGKVTSQSIPAGTRLVHGGRVKLVLK